MREAHVFALSAFSSTACTRVTASWSVDARPITSRHATTASSREGGLAPSEKSRARRASSPSRFEIAILEDLDELTLSSASSRSKREWSELARASDFTRRFQLSERTSFCALLPRADREESGRGARAALCSFFASKLQAKDALLERPESGPGARRARAGAVDDDRSSSSLSSDSSTDVRRAIPDMWREPSLDEFQN